MRLSESADFINDTNMQNKYLFRRYLLFAIALFVNAMGVAYITKAALGTSPITSITYVASMFTPLTMGQWTIILNLLFVLLELPFSGYTFRKTHICSFVVSNLFM